MSELIHLQCSDTVSGLGHCDGWVPPDLLTKTNISTVVDQCIPVLIDLSQRAVDLGHSYKGFKVGAAVLAQSTDQGQVRAFFSGNDTPREDTGWSCAEKRTFEIAHGHGFNRVFAVSVTGPPYSDIAGIESQTCLPCHRCRSMLRESDMVAADAPIVTTNLTRDVIEYNTVASLLRYDTIV